MMTRNNCKQVQITAMNQVSLNNNEAAQQAMKTLNQNECLNAENFQYQCEFTVYSEIALTTIYHPTGCGCAFTIQVRARERERENTPTLEQRFAQFLN